MSSSSLVVRCGSPVRPRRTSRTHESLRADEITRAWWQGCTMDVPQQIAELFEQGAAHERDHDLVPARRLLGAALAAASTAGLSEIVQASHQLLGVVEHKQGRLDEARRHLELGLGLALDAHDLQGEAYARQELGFLRLDDGDPTGALAEFRRTLAIAPGTGIVNLAGNALSGMGVALLDLGRVDEAIPFLTGGLVDPDRNPRSRTTARRPHPSRGCRPARRPARGLSRDRSIPRG